MVQRDELTAYLHALLEVARFRDYAPNGLQVEGAASIRKLVGGVTASRALVEAAVAVGADALLVHHGYFWQGEDPCVVGMKKARLASLLANGVNLFAYHLPLDAHALYGNNTQLAQKLNIHPAGRFGPEPMMAQYGELPAAMSVQVFGEHIARALGRAPLYIEGGQGMIRRVGWCTGAAQKYLEAAAAQGLDAYVSGEISEHTVHAARELGIHYFAAGHHATERYGVAALGDHLALRYDLEFEFIDLHNPV